MNSKLSGAACIESGVTIKGEKQRRFGRQRGNRGEIDPEMVREPEDLEPSISIGMDHVEMDESYSDAEDDDIMEVENPNEF